MTQSLRGDLAKRYLLEDLPGASQLGARLNGILLKIDSGEQVTALQRQFLVATGLHALCALADGKITQGEFSCRAEQEQAARIEEASAKAVKDAAERAACEEAKAAAIKETFAAMANDPVLRRKRDLSDTILSQAEGTPSTGLTAEELFALFRLPAPLRAAA